MKVCIVCGRLSFGGAERVAVSWANGFKQAGHEVMVISNLYDPITYQLDAGIQVRNLVSDNQNKFKKWGSSFFNVRRSLKEFRPDVVICVLPTCSFVSKIAALGLHIPVIATEHDSFERPDSAPFDFWNIFSKFSLNKLFGTVTVLTQADKEVIGNRVKNIHVMPNPLALEPVEIMPQKEKIILAAGRLDAWHYKGFDVLIKAWGKVVESRELRVESEGWRLQIAGTGSEESLEYLKKLCKENGVEDSVDFLGFVSDMESLYKKASVFVLSSRYEGFGLVLIEAMSQGCACIACDYKGRQREIMETLPGPPYLGRGAEVQNAKGDPFFETSTGILCPPEDVEALAAAMEKMIEDEDYRESVRTHAIERSKYYSIENTVARWEELLHSIVQ